jgi:1-acyl-sn-glycerol-3-phosphate acyltransferase
MISPHLTHQAPASGLLKYWFARCWYWLSGWDVIGELPDAKKFVLVGAHHTSNWDFVYGLCGIYIFRLKASWMGKDALFKWPFGFFMHLLGGIAIDRSSPHGVVDQTADQFKKTEKLVVLIAADGTRRKMGNWRSGFYWIAHKAQVPIVCSYLDYERKIACIGLSFIPTGDVKRDMDKIRDFYKDVHGKKPEKETPIVLLDEERR